MNAMKDWRRCPKYSPSIARLRSSSSPGGEKRNAIEAVGAGAYDFLCKPVEIEELRLLLRRCIHVVELEKEYRELQQSRLSDVFEDMLGTSPQMQAVFAFIRKVAGTNAAVLLLGESGTGKEMAAAAIHRRSARKDGQIGRAHV